MLTLSPNGNLISVSMNGATMGSIRLCDNPFHTQNCYVKLNLDPLDPSVSKELFAQLSKIVQRPLQAMVGSDDAETVDFLTSGGFVCRRKCYEVDARKEDWLSSSSGVPLLYAQSGEAAYGRCCEMMYGHYIETHRTINPWTAEFSDFRKNLPEEVIYQTEGERIVNLAFVEGSEIAYLCSVSKSHFASFAPSLVNWLFSVHDTVCFEADDCDWAVMELRAMFANQDKRSFDTYIYK